jgi:hypothetical protein
MSDREHEAAICERVLTHLVDAAPATGAAPPAIELAHADLTEHLGSCVVCFRRMNELRDAPRVGDALREVAPVIPAPDDRFWDALAVRTSAVLESARSPGGRAITPLQSIAAQAGGGAVRRSRASRASSMSSWTGLPRGRRRAMVFAAAAVAAAAVWVLAPHGKRLPPANLGGSRPEVVATPLAVNRAPDTLNDDAGDVAELDGQALRRLLDRLRAQAPVLASFAAAADRDEGPEPLADDDGRMTDAVAGLDAIELRRVESSLAGASSF